MNPMIERVAEAILLKIGTCYPPEDVRPSLALASAAIAAMREPTKAMLDAGDEAQTENGEPVALSAIIAWQAMIDKALEE